MRLQHRGSLCISRTMHHVPCMTYKNAGQMGGDGYFYRSLYEPTEACPQCPSQTRVPLSLDNPEALGARLTVASARGGMGDPRVTAVGADGNFVANGPALLFSERTVLMVRGGQRV